MLGERVKKINAEVAALKKDVANVFLAAMTGNEGSSRIAIIKRSELVLNNLSAEYYIADKQAGVLADFVQSDKRTLDVIISTLTEIAETGCAKSVFPTVTFNNEARELAKKALCVA